VAVTKQRVTTVRLQRDVSENDTWLVPIPDQCIQGLHQSTGLSYGTSFSDGASVTIWMLGHASGTALGGSGTAFGILIGTGLK